MRQVYGMPHARTDSICYQLLIAISAMTREETRRAASLREGRGSRIATSLPPVILLPHVSHPDEFAAGADRGGRECVRRRHHRSEALGAFLPPLLRRARRRFHAGDGAGRDGAGEYPSAWRVWWVSYPRGILARPFL